jgi:hypothetical protein
LAGTEIRRQFKSKPVLNVNVLDYLLAQPRLIPKLWEGKVICFWGTIYREKNTEDAFSLRALTCGRHDWYWYWLELDTIFLENHVAALRA